MNTKKMAKRLKDSAVSPVIATILMVAITVVLAAVLYVMVSGFTHSPGTANSAGLSAAQNGKYWNVTITSISASNIQLSNLKVVISGATGSSSVTSFNANWPYTTSGQNVTFVILNGNSATYLQVGDLIVLNAGSLATANGLTGATVTLYNGNSQLGSTTL